MDKNGKFCRCLLADFWPDLHATVEEIISLLPEDQKTPEQVYAQRLDICRACDHLHNGTCALCGCYVESRAAKRTQKCPDVPPKWGPCGAE